jgi:hypothetical protein
MKLWYKKSVTMRNIVPYVEESMEISSAEEVNKKI